MYTCVALQMPRTLHLQRPRVAPGQVTALPSRLASSELSFKVLLLQFNSLLPLSLPPLLLLLSLARWSCLHRQPALEADAMPPCYFTKPQLLSFYCSAARFVNATCSDPAYVPLPAGGECPTLPPEGTARPAAVFRA